MPRKMTKYEKKKNQIDKSTWQGEHLENRKRGKKRHKQGKIQNDCKLLVGNKESRSQWKNTFNVIRKYANTSPTNLL